MAQNIKSICKKIETIKNMAESLRDNPPSDKILVKNAVDLIQSDCLLVAKAEIDYENENENRTNDKDHHYDYNGVDVDSL
tara:strand:- start:31 stop:270 length:240 start_codon:yes stop_codon:yes gene_type:complete